MTAPPSRMRAPLPTDRDLLLRFRSGDEPAFEQLYERYRHRLTSYAARLLGRIQAAEDVTTEAFVRLVDRPLDVDGPSLRGWLFTVTHRLCLDRLRGWDRRARILGWLAPRWAAPQVTTDDRLALEQRDAKLQQAILRLSPKHRAVVLLTYHEGLTSPEVAQILECTDQQVRSRLAYARRLLRADLGSDDVE